ncbi:cyclic nucleotide-binding domain-containing protein [Bdellovibrio reynosensis]|uniref:Cyclic nucleotide-binding domain-containing protein n=1 Tax=Bdellovibrio reynosensis TaxID=2835041 RepID=A0ABY4C8A6_9BACT|nr:cyclic nucleotide-binding domain-containing protein [Bdellovibrio reynosensis]UOF01155.1 cyclic nucleotide-binding domain-containing protein [Bdellovibrio reynosensis]
MAELENKRVFLIVSGKPEEMQAMVSLVERSVPGATIFTAADGQEALFKSENVPPHIVILDAEVQKLSAVEVTEKLIHRKERIAVIIVSPLPDNESFVNEVVTGQVHILTRPTDEKTFLQHMTRAMNWIAHGDNSGYRMCFLTPNELLIREGEKAKCVYLVKRGELKAFRLDDSSNEVLLGMIRAGEFVGEMAYINGEDRNAHVMSLTDCELIEIPNDCLDTVLFSKPAWSKALVKTLSTRLKHSNEEKVVSNEEKG